MSHSRPLTLLLAVASLIVAVSLLAGCGPSVPDVVGMKESDAVSKMKSAGYKVVAVVPGTSGDVKIGQIAAQEPAAKSAVAKGAEVTLTVCVNDTKQVKVPSFKDSKSLPEFAQKLAAYGLIPRIVETYGEGPTGATLRQIPDGGTTVPGDQVIIIVSADAPAKGTKKVPDVVGLDRFAAEKKLADAGFAPVMHTVRSTEATEGYVYDQTPPAGKLAPKGAGVLMLIAVKK